MAKLAERQDRGFKAEGGAGAGNAGTLDCDYRTSIGVDREYFSGFVKETTAWDIYNNEARKVDRELVKDWTASLNFLLVFAAIFSAVLAAFIIESKKLLEQDPTEVMLDVLVFQTNNLANGTHLPYKRAEFTPSDAAISINCLLFGSLSISLVAALASVVALQWVADFDASITRGGSSPQDRAKRRQYRFAGLRSWRMGELIASLPLLLYASVVLFFAGVIQWTLILSFTVGCVVICGAATTLLFYFTSTFLAVLFDSAPFNTPLSRWIYFGSRRLIILIRGLIILPYLGSAPQQHRRSRDSSHAPDSREDRAVYSRIDLSYQALNWLARQISISEDSRRRLVILVGELLEWPLEQLEAPDFKKSPWISILNFLAQKHRAALQVQTQSRDEERELALLINCSALPTIRAMIAPSDELYWSNPDEARYWSQYCTETGFLLTSFYSFARSSHAPDPLFLLTRDLPIPSLGIEDEMKSAMCLARWRNSDHKPLEIWMDVFASSNQYSDEFFNASVCLLHSNSMLSSLTRPSAEVNRLDIIAEIAKRAVTGTISSVALVALIRAFEHTLDPYKFWLFHKSPSCIQRPISYGRNLQYGDEVVKQIHRTLTLLLARDLQGCSGPESMRRFPEVLAMLWLTPSTANPHDWRTLEQKYEIHCRVGDLPREILPHWVLHLDGSPQLVETLYILIQTSSAHPEVGVHWLSSCAEQSSKHLFSLLRQFDALMCDEQLSRSRVKILKILCRMLRMDTFGTRIAKRAPGHSMMALQSPFIRTIGYRALEVATINENIPEYPLDQSDLLEETSQFLFWNMSSADAQSVWQLRARFISKSLDRCSSSVITRLIKDSFKNIEHLSNLTLIFNHATLCAHHSGPGHVLVHLNMEPTNQITYPHDLTLLGEVQATNCQITPIIALLVVSSADEFLSLDLWPSFDDECMAQLSNIYAAFKSHQPSMLAFLHDILVSHSEFQWNYELATLAIILQTIEETVGLPTDGAELAYLQLSKALLQLSSYIKKHSSHRRQCVVLTLHTERIRSIILSKLSTTLVFGRMNLRLLACARMEEGALTDLHPPMWVP